MTHLVDQARVAVVAEARTWLRTPYHHQGRVKGAGVDCAMLLCDVYYRCGLIPFIDPRPYPPDWYLHRSEERYLGWVEKFAQPLESVPLPGDLVVWRFGRCFAHGAIVQEWPLVIHAYAPERQCTVSDVTVNPRLSNAGRRRYYTLWRQDVSA